MWLEDFKMKLCGVRMDLRGLSRVLQGDFRDASKRRCFRRVSEALQKVLVGFNGFQAASGWFPGNFTGIPGFKRQVSGSLSKLNESFKAI